MKRDRKPPNRRSDARPNPSASVKKPSRGRPLQDEGGPQVTLVIDQLGPKGDGISGHGRTRVYVDRALPGDRLKVQTRRDEEGLTRGDIMDVLSPAPSRVIPPCPNYNRCGGCAMQHANDDFYEGWKQDVVRQALEKQGLRPRFWHEPVFVAPATRRRATFATYLSRGHVVMGYYRRRSHLITDIETCLVVLPQILKTRDAVRPYLKPFLREGKAVDVFIQTAVSGGPEVVVTGPVGAAPEPDAQTREAMIRMAHECGLSRVSWRKNEREQPEAIISRNPLVARFGELDVFLPPMAFLQPTAPGEQALADAVMRALPEKGKFADLFSGCGTFTGPMLARGSVDAYESGETAITALSKATRGMNVKTFKRDLFRQPLRREELNRYDAVVFDPPRAGCAEQAREMSTCKVKRLVGVSCNPATFARDARVLCDGGYRLESVQVVDQFTWSAHVELVAVFTR